MGVPEVRIGLFGGFRVVVDGRAVPETAWRRRKAAAVVKLVALAPSHQLHREQLMDALWPDLSPAASAANLRKAVHHARRALGSDAVLRSEGDLLRLPEGRLWVDVDAFRAAVGAARAGGDLADHRRAVDLYRDGLLPEDCYEEWSAGPRASLHDQFVTVLREMAAVLEASGEVDLAIDVQQRLIAAEPLREESHEAVMRLHALAGRRAQAMDAYQRLTAILDAELGAEPSPAAQRLFEEIRGRQTFEPELTRDVWERVGDLRTTAGDAAGAARAYQAALAAAGGEATGRIERKCAETWLMQHRPDIAAGHLAAADGLLQDEAERGRLLRAQANHAWETGDLTSAQQYAERARDLAIAHGTADDRAAAHEALAIVSHLRGRWREGLESELHGLSSEEAGTAQLARVYDIHHCIGQYHLYGDGLSGSVEDFARRMLDRAEEAGAHRAEAFAWCLLGESLLLQARWDEAAGCLERSCALHAALGSRSGGLAWQRLAELAVCRGAFDEAAEHLRQAAAIATVSAMASHLWGRIHATQAFAAIEQGHAEDAIRAVRAADGSAARYGDCPTCSALLNPIAAEAFARVDDCAGARRYADSAARVAGMFTSSAWRAMGESAAASLARCEGDDRLAHQRFTAARDLYTRAGQPYWVERSVRVASTTPA